MKKIYFFFLFLAFYAFSIQGQVKPVIDESSFKFQGDMVDGFTITIPYDKPDDVQKAWIKTIEKGSKQKAVVSGSSEIAIEQALLKAISDSTINIYSKIESTDTAVYLYSAFKMYSGDFIQSGTFSSEATRARVFLFDFAKSQYSETLKEEGKAEEGKLKDLEKELKKMINDKDGMEKKIAKYNNDILRAEDEISEYEHDLGIKQDELGDQKRGLASIPSANTEAVKEQKAAVKSVEKDKKKIYRSIKRNQKKIVGYKNKIQQLEMNIQTNLLDQEKQRERIIKQSGEVQKASARMETLKIMRL